MADIFGIRRSLGEGKSIYDLKLRVAFYARVSTETYEQHNSLENQTEYYEKLIFSSSNWQFAGGYADEGISGTSVSKRTSFMRMIDDAEKNMFDLIITKEISRFSRNTCDSITYCEKLLSAGVGVLFQTDNICTFYPDAELRLAIMSSIAQDEVRKISERVRFGLRRAMEKGVVLGNGNIYGYDKSCGKLTINRAQAEIVRRIFFSYVTEQKGIRRIAEEITNSGVDMSYSTVKSIITNPVYCGVYAAGKSYKPSYKSQKRCKIPEEQWIKRPSEDIPPIISPEIFEEAYEKYRQRSGASAHKTNEIYTYSSLIYCSEHSEAYYHTFYRYSGTSREAWQCRHYAAKGKEGCLSPVIYSDELDDICRQIIRIMKVNMDTLANEIYRVLLTISGADKEIDIAESRRRIINLYRKGLIDDDEFENSLSKLEKQTAKCEIPAFETVKQCAENIKITRGIAEALLEKVIPYGDKKHPNADVYTKFGYCRFTLQRFRGKKTFVCCEQYI